MPLHCMSLHCILLKCTALFVTAMHTTALYCEACHCTVSNCTVMHWTGQRSTLLHKTAVFCTTLNLHFTAVYYTLLHFTTLKHSKHFLTFLYSCFTVLLQYVVHCTVLYCKIKLQCTLLAARKCVSLSKIWTVACTHQRWSVRLHSTQCRVHVHS